MSKLNKLQQLLLVSSMFAPRPYERDPTPKCKRIAPDHRGKVKKCKYCGPCDGYKYPCKFRL